MPNMQTGRTANEVQQWLNWADKDYLGARILLMNGLVVQGAALANTAIEKYLKAVFSYSGMPVPRTHDTSSLYNQIKRARGGELSIREDFLEVLNAAYRLRYPDDLRPGFNIALNTALLLVELDTTVAQITRRFRIQAGGREIPTVLARATQQGDRRILDDNVAAGEVKKQDLFQKESRSLDYRVQLDGTTIEIEYTTLSLQDSASFNVPGFLQTGSGQFQVAYPPMHTRWHPSEVDK